METDRDRTRGMGEEYGGRVGVYVCSVCIESFCAYEMGENKCIDISI